MNYTLMLQRPLVLDVWTFAAGTLTLSGQTGQTGLPAVKSAMEGFKLVFGPAVIPLVGQTVPESILMFSRATIFHVSDQSYLVLP